METLRPKEKKKEEKKKKKETEKKKKKKKRYERDRQAHSKVSTQFPYLKFSSLFNRDSSLSKWAITDQPQKHFLFRRVLTVNASPKYNRNWPSQNMFCPVRRRGQNMFF